MPRMFWNLLTSLAIAYGAVVLLVYLFQGRLVYFPQVGREIAVTPQAYGLAFDAVTIATADGEKLAAWWVPAASAHGAALIFHGNAGNISHRLDYLAMFHRLGYSTLIIDYRGYGASTGSPTEEGTYRDAEAAWRWLTVERGMKPGDIVLFGESLGGAVAAWLAKRLSAAADASVDRPRSYPEGGAEARDSSPAVGKKDGGSRALRALVLASTFTSVPDLGSQVYPFLPVRLISRFSYDNLAAIREVKAPVLVAHSREDDIIPYAHGRTLFEAAREPKNFLEMRGGHNDGFVFMRPEWVAQLAGFLERAAAR
jgi:uncharacterized protein